MKLSSDHLFERCSRAIRLLCIAIAVLLLTLLAVRVFPSQTYAFENGSTNSGLQYALKASATETTKTDNIKPDKPSIAVTSKRACTVIVKAEAGEVDGYEFMASPDRKFKTTVKRKVAKENTQCFVASLAPTRWYARARAYRIVDGRKVYGPWSSVGAVVTKRLTVAVTGSFTKTNAAGWLGKNGCKMVHLKSSKFNMQKYDALVMPGGEDVTPSLYGAKPHPRTYGCDIELDKLQIAVVKKFIAAKKPILGVCRGAQITNVALGGTLFQHISGWHKHDRKVKVKKGSWLYSNFGSYEWVPHWHHQCVLKLGKGLIATQWDAKDNRIEAFEHESLPIYGLQWHVEDMGSRSRIIARKFMKVCALNNRNAFYGK